jgi:hypothetical protein
LVWKGWRGRDGSPLLVFPPGEEGEGKEESKGPDADELATSTATLEKELEFVLSLGAHRLAIEPADFEKDQVGFMQSPPPHPPPRGTLSVYNPSVLNAGTACVCCCCVHDPGSELPH